MQTVEISVYMLGLLSGLSMVAVLNLAKELCRYLDGR